MFRRLILAKETCWPLSTFTNRMMGSIEVTIPITSVHMLVVNVDILVEVHMFNLFESDEYLSSNDFAVPVVVDL